MPRALTQEEVEEHLHAHGCVLLSKYTTCKQKITILCKCGHERTSTFGRIKHLNQYECKICVAEKSTNKYFKISDKQMHPKTFKKMKRLMERKYEMTKKYQNDFLPENYNKTFTCLFCKKSKSIKFFTYLNPNKKSKRCKECLRINKNTSRQNETVEQ
jgi:transcription elongation factor Elf1